MSPKKTHLLTYPIVGIGWFVGMVVVFLFICIARLFYIQIIQGEAYSQMAKNQYVPTVTPIFNRGSVFMLSKNGETTPFASLEEFYILAINPNNIRDTEKAYTSLTKTGVVVNKKEFLDKAAKKNDPYEEIAKNVPKKVIEELKKEKIKGFEYIKNFRRLYPQKEVGSQVIGFVGNDGVVMRGQYGIERTYENILERTSSVPVNMFADVFSDVNDTINQKVKKEDADIVLTLEPTMQKYLYNTLVETKAKWGSRAIGGIIMNPNTGAIIAMDALPSFNPNEFSGYASARYTNPNVEAVYEMGSIIKPLTIAAGLDTGVITENTTYNDTGTLLLSGYRVSNYDKKARGVVPMQKILDQSLNVGATFIQQKLGKKVFADYFNDAFGLGQKTGIDLPNEVKSLTRNLSSREDVNYATASFGQGIALSPIATIRALATLSNGGLLVTPHIVQEIVYKDGRREKIKHGNPVQVLKKETSETITRMLVQTVDNALLGGKKKMEVYAVAAKTGTAEIPKAGGGYRSDVYLHSLFAYFPAYNPKFIVLLYQLEPNSIIGASETLSDPIFKIASFALSYYGVPPDRK